MGIFPIQSPPQGKRPSLMKPLQNGRRSWERGGLRVFASLALQMALLVLLSPVSAAASAATYYVAASGSDVGSCLSPGTPCKSIQFALNKTASGDTVLVAAGTYSYNSLADPCSFLVTRAVACVVDKNVSLRGGFSPSNWLSADPIANPTLIDGANSYRGVAVIAYNQNVSFRMEGFTIQNGLARGAASPDGFANSGRGGGLWAQNSAVALKNVNFKHNQAQGANGYAGAADGGALMIESTRVGSSSLENVTFDGNRATGGSGSPRGGFAIGGALFTYRATLNANQVSFSSNTAQAGSSSAGGRDSAGLTADALGGACGFQLESTITLSNISATNNTASGGNAGSTAGSIAGAGLGGFMHLESTTLSLRSARIQGNQAVGGSASTGGLGIGGGIMADRANITLDQAWVINNLAKAGSGTAVVPATGAGGAFFGYFGSSTTPPYTALIRNSVFAANSLAPGPSGPAGGGGVVVQGVQAVIAHSTFASNGASGGTVNGEAILVQGSQGESGNAGTLSLSNSILSDHSSSSPASAVIAVLRGSTLTLNTVLSAANNKLTNQDGLPISAGKFTLTNLLTAPAIHYLSPAAPDYNFHLRSDSPAIDKAASSSLAVDIDNEPRPYNLLPDLGADEYQSKALNTSPNRIVCMGDSQTAASIPIQITDSLGNAVGWTATEQTSWLSLGTTPSTQLVSGGSGDMLVLTIRPGSLPNGTYQAEITLTSSQGETGLLLVQLTKVSHVSNVFLPLAIR